MRNIKFISLSQKIQRLTKKSELLTKVIDRYYLDPQALIPREQQSIHQLMKRVKNNELIETLPGGISTMEADENRQRRIKFILEHRKMKRLLVNVMS